MWLQLRCCALVCWDPVSVNFKVRGAWDARNGFGGVEQELEVWNMVRGFQIKGQSYGVRIKGSGARIRESGIIE